MGGVEGGTERGLEVLKCVSSEGTAAVVGAELGAGPGAEFTRGSDAVEGGPDAELGAELRGLGAKFRGLGDVEMLNRGVELLWGPGTAESVGGWRGAIMGEGVAPPDVDTMRGCCVAAVETSVEPREGGSDREMVVTGGEERDCCLLGLLAATLVLAEGAAPLFRDTTISYSSPIFWLRVLKLGRC